MIPGGVEYELRESLVHVGELEAEAAHDKLPDSTMEKIRRARTLLRMAKREIEERE